MTIDKLESLYREGRATLPVDHVNHREYVYSGVRYFMGWSSQRDTAYVKKTWDAPEYKVAGWLLYKQEVI